MVLCCNLRHVEGTIVFGILLWKCDLSVLLSVANFSLGILLPLLGLAGPQKCKLLGLLLQICCEQLATTLHFTLLQTQPAVHWELAHKKISQWFPAGSSFVYVTKLMILLHPVLPDSCRFYSHIVDVMTTASFYCLKFLCLRPCESEDLAGDRKQPRCIFCFSVRRCKSGPEV